MNNSRRDAGPRRNAFLVLLCVLAALLWKIKLTRAEQLSRGEMLFALLCVLAALRADEKNLTRRGKAFFLSTASTKTDQAYVYIVVTP
jgi:hypothetical protein